jgi:parallel beta-helix repeat protein
MARFLTNKFKMAFLLSVAVLLAAGSSFAQQHVYLSAQGYTKSLPGGVSVSMWGYAACDSSWTCGAPTSPGPQIDIAPGMTSLVVHLQNQLSTPVSFVIPGQSGGGLGQPVMEGDRMRSLVPEIAAGATGTYTFNTLKIGTFLYESGTHQPIQVPMGLYGAVVVRSAANQAYPAADSVYDQEAILLFSEIDPVQNAAASAAASPADYPKAIKYNPTYFLINGVPFDKTNRSASTISLTAPVVPATQGTVLLRLLNAGSQSHTPYAVELPLKLIAEDGNVFPDRKTQNDVLLGAGKTMDAIATITQKEGTFDRTYPVFDRMLDLTSGGSDHDSGMLAYLKVGNGSADQGPGSGPTANNDIFAVGKGTPFSGNVLGNDLGVNDAKLVSSAQNGTVTLSSDGSFTYTPNAHFSGPDMFAYSALTGVSNVAIVTLNVAFGNEAPIAANDGTFSNNVGMQISVTKPGVLGNDTDYDGDTLTAVVAGSPLAGLTLNSDGSFSYSGPAGDYTFQYQARDASGTLSNIATVTLHMSSVSGLTLTVLDPADSSKTPITDYRWLVEEDRTWHHEEFTPNGVSLGTNFHASYMPVVAQGCEGPNCAQPVPISDVVLDPNKFYYVSVLPNDAGDAGHSIGGAPLGKGQTSATVLVNPQPKPTAQISVLIFEDNFPTNGINDDNEQGLGNFQLTVIDAGGRYGANGGQMSFDSFGNPLKNMLPCAPFQPTGVILTCADGTALIQNLAPGKYTILADPPANSGKKWVQTSTIEGTRGIDAWVKSGEPSFFQEFGPPGYHVFIGFVSPQNMPTNNGSNVVSGTITNLHMSRPPDQTIYDSGSRDALAFTTCWVGLSDGNGTGRTIAIQQCQDDGGFSFSRIPNGTYQLVIWDQFLDQIIAFRTLTVPGGGNLGTVPVFSWFSRAEHNIFIDTNLNGIWDEGEQPLPNAPVAMRFRDGSMYQFSTTDNNGYYSFDETFPFFNWIVAEADPGNRKTTGLNVTVDGGGAVDNGGVLNPQVQSDGISNQRIQLGPVRTQGFQGFLGQTAVLNWGRVPYQPGENGGITGVISYASTRSEDDPRMAAVNTWEPNVPAVKVRLYREVKTASGGNGLVFVKETTSSSWDASLPTGCPGQDPSDPFFTDILGVHGDPIDKCYDGMHVWNQVRPGVYDGRYSFTDIAAGTYVVEAVLPQGYELVKEEDKNVFIGDAYIAPVGVVTPVFGVVDVMPDQAIVESTFAPSPGIAVPPCVGDMRIVPADLSLFPTSAAPYAGATRPLCDRKEVTLTDQSQATADFHVFTSVPIAGHFTGMILDDLSQEFNPASPNFGEKFAPPFVPVSIRDYNGVEIGRVYSDQWGMFNGLLPSTFSANVPLPSGYSPAMHITCMNDPGPIPDGHGGLMTDPQYNPMYSNFCYTMQYMPGTTTYLDTPVLPVAAFASGFNPVDCSYPEGTPTIKQVNGDGDGPFINPTGARQLTITSLGAVAVPNPAYEGPSAVAPYNEKTINRDFGFGNVPGTVKIGNVTLTISSWTSDQIVAIAPAGTSTGQLTVTRGDNGTSTVTSVTVTVENLTPVRVSQGQSIQAAIDNAAPESLILVGPGQYEELVVMWKPVRLQGSGAGATIINAAKYPTQKLDAWRTKVQSLFDNGTIDLLPGQNGVDGAPLIGPGLFGNEEGAGITVLAKNDSPNQPAGPNSFLLSDSSIDGFGVTGGDTGGGIFVNGYAHNLQIGNNKVYGNSGFYHGGIRVGDPSLESLTGNGPFRFNSSLNIHHNTITTNGSVSPGSAGGGISLCTGTDNYRVNYNFICGNFSVGHGGGIGHYGLSDGGVIANNQILFNQSFDQGTNESGGGIFIGGENPTTGLTLGAGSVTVDSNLIQGNHAGAGHGGGIRLQQVNGADIARSRTNMQNWWQVTVTNNMIANNVAGWSGGGISLADTARSTIINNTITDNDSTSTVGVTFTAGPSVSLNQPAGVSSERHSTALAAAFTNSIVTQPYRYFSNPALNNNIIWHNRSFHYDATSGNAGVVPILSQSTIGECPSGANYWDLGVLGDTTPAPGTLRLNPSNSVLTDTTGYAASNKNFDPQLKAAYCNGPRTLRLVDAPTTIVPLPALDEGGNWIDVRWGPLTKLGDYHIADTSPAADAGAGNGSSHDFDGQSRPAGAAYDIGADEVASNLFPVASTNPTAVDFGLQRVGASSRTVTLSNTGTATLQIGNISVSGTGFLRTLVTPGTCGSSVAVGSSCTINVSFVPTTYGPKTGALTIASNDPVNPTITVPLSGTGYQIDLNSSSLTFTYTPNTRTRTVTVRNWGVSAVAMSAPTLTGANASNFAITGNTCGSSLGAAFFAGVLPRTCTITVQFTSSTNTPAGGLKATLNVNDADPTSPQQVSLTGTRP